MNNFALVLAVAIGAYFLSKLTGLGALVGEHIMDARVKAFLYVIRYAEGTLGVSSYRTLYGGATWIGVDTDHPRKLGWGGGKLSPEMCRGAGLPPGCVSTAAGAYQFISPTWERLKSKLSLPNFGSASQDRAALELIKERGALPDVMSGNFASALWKVRKEWASLPGASYGQPEKTLASLERVYDDALKRFA